MILCAELGVSSGPPAECTTRNRPNGLCLRRPPFFKKTLGYVTGQKCPGTIQKA